MDFRQQITVMGYLSSLVHYIKERENVDISQHLNLSTIAAGMLSGDLAIYNTCKNIGLELENSVSWWGGVSQSKMERIEKILQAYDKSHLEAYMFNYQIPNIGVIKKVRDDIVRIVGKKKIR